MKAKDKDMFRKKKKTLLLLYVVILTNDSDSPTEAIELIYYGLQ